MLNPHQLRNTGLPHEGPKRVKGEFPNLRAEPGVGTGINKVRISMTSIGWRMYVALKMLSLSWKVNQSFVDFFERDMWMWCVTREESFVWFAIEWPGDKTVTSMNNKSYSYSLCKPTRNKGPRLNTAVHKYWLANPSWLPNERFQFSDKRKRRKRVLASTLQELRVDSGDLFNRLVIRPRSSCAPCMASVIQKEIVSIR